MSAKLPHANFAARTSTASTPLDGSLNPVFSVVSAGTYRVVCGASGYTFTVSNVYWVDPRPLSGVYEAILRDSSGGILARYACSPPSSVSYVGFKNVQSFTLNVWGVPP
ncbi:MAG: hypothetical protein LM580_06350 [Thermofilum sp.]|nr:hypothetical protein [Thermofilum sp.]